MRDAAAVFPREEHVAGDGVGERVPVVALAEASEVLAVRRR
nr:hypothetical protein [Haloferax sp. ATB1]